MSVCTKNISGISLNKKNSLMNTKKYFFTLVINPGPATHSKLTKNGIDQAQQITCYTIQIIYTEIILNVSHNSKIIYTG
jgi:hypothetical protein